jgi:hypothetical protein
LQPYARTRGDRKIYFLTALNRLSNADKHYQLAITPYGLDWPTTTIDHNLTFPEGHAFIKDGAEIYRSESDVHVDVDVEGTPQVLIRMGRDPANPEMTVASLDDMLRFVRGMVIDILLPYMRR